MKKSSINPMPEYFDRYINLVPDIELQQAFDDSIAQLHAINRNIFTALDGKRYLPDKWTVKDILQHVIDTERIFAYRTLRFARHDQTALPGFDENTFAENTTANHRTIDALLDELLAVRAANKLMFASFSDDMLLRTGKSFKSEISVLAMGFNIIGHQMHHLNVIQDRYIPLVK